MENLKATPNRPKRESQNYEQLEAKAAKVGKDKTIRITADLPVEMHKSIKLKSVNQGKTIREYIINLIENDLNTIA